MSVAEGLAENLLEELRSTYIAQLPGRIDEIEALILELERGGDYVEIYGALYRGVHSLKGSGGTYGFPIITSICHQFEDYLALMDAAHARGGTVAVDLLLGYIDVLRETCRVLQQSPATFSTIETQLLNLKKQAMPNTLSGLLVERSPLHISIVKEILGDYPVNLSVVKDGITALHRLMTEPFDFIITSQEVGDLSGTAMVAALRLSRSVNRNVSIILLTSNQLDDLPEAFKPNVVIRKDSNIQKNIRSAVNDIFY